MMSFATLGGGCYWCLDAFFRRIRGITSVTSGYSGGHTERPTMNEVYRGDTGHAEVIQLEFDPAQISYKEILEIFFVMHDPTTLNRQGNDVGDEYRSVIFYHDEEQAETARQAITSFAPSLWEDPVVTQLEPLDTFWPADEANQDYFAKNPTAGYCLAVIEPKVSKLRQQFTEKFIQP